MYMVFYLKITELITVFGSQLSISIYKNMFRIFILSVHNSFAVFTRHSSLAFSRSKQKCIYIPCLSFFNYFRCCSLNLCSRTSLDISYMHLLSIWFLSSVLVPFLFNAVYTLVTNYTWNVNMHSSAAVESTFCSAINPHVTYF